jgi:hypothetical protein
MVELAYKPGIESAIDGLRAAYPALVISIGVPLDAEAVSTALLLAQRDVDTMHFYADSHGNGVGADRPRFLTEMIGEIHDALVGNTIRDKVNLLVSGGVALAEHLAKAVICGADGVVIDYPLLVALGCRVCRVCRADRSCPVKLEEVDLDWGRQRLINLMAAWRNQLLEVMGAMGIREARRLRGEVGRLMRFDDLERESFAPIFGGRQR